MSENKKYHLVSKPSGFAYAPEVLWYARDVGTNIFQPIMLRRDIAELKSGMVIETECLKEKTPVRTPLPALFSKDGISIISAPLVRVTSIVGRFRRFYIIDENLYHVPGKCSFNALMLDKKGLPIEDSAPIKLIVPVSKIKTMNGVLKGFALCTGVTTEGNICTVYGDFQGGFRQLSAHAALGNKPVKKLPRALGKQVDADIAAAGLMVAFSEHAPGIRAEALFRALEAAGNNYRVFDGVYSRIYDAVITRKPQADAFFAGLLKDTFKVIDLYGMDGCRALIGSIDRSANLALRSQVTFMDDIIATVSPSLRACGISPLTL